ncbi:DUF3800 domain-containing protein [Chloroflexota bacterium]
MHIAYYDESGDDGYPLYSSEFFILACIYMDNINWQSNYDNLYKFRVLLKKQYKLPVRMELHTKKFILNKKPYRSLRIPENDRLEIIEKYIELLSSLDVSIINVVIVKPRIRNSNYPVLDRAFTYSIQRIENDLDPVKNPNKKFLIISDEGRVGMMRKTARKIKKINFIPSKYSMKSYRQEITTLIEDPLPKNSKESYFIQSADLVSYIVYLYTRVYTQIGGLPTRLPSAINSGLIIDWMEKLKPSLNTNAAQDDPFGIVYHPK